MFRIIGDEIEFQQRVVGRFTVPTFDTWRNRAADLLEDMNPDRTEEERDAAIKEIEDSHRDEIAVLEKKIEDLEDSHRTDIANLESEIETFETTISDLQDLLGALNEGATVAELIAEARAETAKWREIAETNRRAYLEATAPKSRKRRSPPVR